MNHEAIALELLAMRDADQAMRRASRDPEGEWRVEVDQKHALRLREIIATIGWPTISLVGKEASRAAWLLAQHADHDPKFQEFCLGRLQSALSDVDPANTAMLTDRVLVMSGCPQVYGTQFHKPDSNGPWVPRPIEDVRGVNERRAAVGLPSLEEGVKIINGT